MPKRRQKPFFISIEELTTDDTTPCKVSKEEEVKLLMQQEIPKTKQMLNLQNFNRVDCMLQTSMNEKDKNKIYQFVIEKTFARCAKQE